eukprot:190038-Hanusia_phi.AAC.1
MSWPHCRVKPLPLKSLSRLAGASPIQCPRIIAPDSEPSTYAGTGGGRVRSDPISRAGPATRPRTGPSVIGPSL